MQQQQAPRGGQEEGDDRDAPQRLARPGSGEPGQLRLRGGFDADFRRNCRPPSSAGSRRVRRRERRLAERISRFDEVESCYLMSGGYDLLVFVNGASLQKVAAFVSEKLSTIEGVLSTATHFMLRSYKENGFLLEGKAEENERLKVSP